MRPLLEVREGQLLQSGLYPSLAPNQDALWRDGENILFVDGSVEKMRGYSVQSVYAGEVINALAQSYSEGDKRVYLGTNDALRVWVGGVTTVLGDDFMDNSRWSLETWGDWLVATNDINPVQVWKGGLTGAEPLAGVPFTHARIVRKLSNHLLFYNTNNGGQMVEWSSRSNIEEYEATELTTAGNFFIRDLDGDITCVEPLNNALAFYTEDSMGLTEYVGGSFIFTHRVRLNGIGAVGRNAVCAVKGMHYGVSRKGIWTCDGFSFDYVDDPAVNRWIDDNVDWTKGEEVLVFHNENRRMVCFYFRCKDDVIRGLGLNYQARAWTKFKLPVTAAVEAQVFDQPIVGLEDELGFFDVTNNAGVGALSFFLRSAFTDAGDRGSYKLWDKLKTHMTEHIGLVQVRFGFAEEPNDDVIEWTDWEELALENWIGRESVFLVVEFQSEALGSKWRLGGLELHGEVTGVVG